jgi:hypothetical protein
MNLIRAALLCLLIAIALAACNARPIPTPTSQPFPTNTNTVPPLPTLTPFGSISGITPSPISFATFALPATSAAPATVAPVSGQNPFPAIPSTRILTNGRGLTTGSSMFDGNFEVEGYCNLLNTGYGVNDDGTNWYCTFQGQNALLLRQEHFDDICRRTYNNMNAVAYQTPNTSRPSYAWRCIEFTVALTPTPQRFPILAMNGRGMSTGSVMNEGNFEVEAYCSRINASYGVTRDDNYWYCTQNGQRILTLGVAEFDDICIRTYNNPAAYAEQIQNTQIPVFRWRCYILQ